MNIKQSILSVSQSRAGHRMGRKKGLSSLRVVLFLLITYWSILSVASYEIWSVYFDDTMPSISEDNRTRRQLFEVPFSQVRHIFEIATYINETTGSQIRRMELSVCEPVLPSSFYLLPSGESLVSPSGASYVCLQRLATQSTPISPNASIVQFPPNVGLPLNGDRLAASMASSAVLLTVEYLQDFHLLQDNSGFDLYLSDEPLPIEAGIMAVGLVPDHRFIVPPNVSEWTTAGTCHSSCLADKMEQEELSIVAMFANTNHRALQELALYVKAPDGSSQKIYAWGGQTSVDMSQVPTFSLRHQLQVQCTYEGNKRTLMGGLSDGNENCVLWLLYYPRIPLNGCFSSYSAATLMSLLDVSELNATITRNVGLDVNIQGEPLVKFVDEKDRSGGWDRAKVMRSRYSVLNGRQVAQCGWKWNSEMPELRRRRRKRR